MNYLAHAYLSFNQPEILVGNMISDFVKGKKKFDYPSGIQKGIALHRMIDTFTDAHPATKKAKEVFRPEYRLYAGAFVDVVYDHFLALDSEQFTTPLRLEVFSKGVYKTLDNYFNFLPQQFQNLFPFMKVHNWLYNYQFRNGIEKSFSGIARRAVYLNESSTAFYLFNKNYGQLSEYYHNFFPQLKKYAAHHLHSLLDE